MTGRPVKTEIAGSTRGVYDFIGLDWGPRIWISFFHAEHFYINEANMTKHWHLLDAGWGGRHQWYSLYSWYPSIFIHSPRIWISSKFPDDANAAAGLTTAHAVILAQLDAVGKASAAVLILQLRKRRLRASGASHGHVVKKWPPSPDFGGAALQRFLPLHTAGLCKQEAS